MRALRWRRADFACLAVIALGVALFAKGLAYPVYWNRTLASELKHAACAGNGVSQGAVDALALLRTPRHELMQTGLSIAFGTIAVCIIFLIYRDASGRLTTPRKRFDFLCIGWLVIGLSAISQFVSYDLDARRDDILWCQDSPAAMIVLGVMYVFMAAVLTLAGFFATTAFRQLPARLWQWDRVDLARSVTVTALFALAMAMVGLLAILGLPTSAFLGTPAAAAALYLLESARSAMLAQGDKTDVPD